MNPRHLLEVVDLTREQARAILDDAHRRKTARGGRPKGAADDDAPLAGHTLAMIFEKPSTRTRVSFQMAMRQLGGDAIVLSAGDLQLGRGESIADTARVLSRYVDAAMVRANAHADLEAFAAAAGVPVVNGLTERAHPTQALADVLTVEERLGRPVHETRWAWLGDGNNVSRSLIGAATVLGFELNLACPHGYDPAAALLYAQALGASVRLTRDAAEAVAGADVVVTDTWTSMGEAPDPRKMAAMRPYQVTPELMARARPQALFLHCLPAHRGEEVLDAVIDGPMSAVWDEAENRLHIQKAILLWCLNKI